jgi:RHS repeat-associated protein
MRTELALGADYASQKLIAGQRTYDSLGRVVFEADPFPSTQSFATAYGTTRYFNADGTPSCVIRGNGPQPFTMVTDELHEIYPTCVQHAYQDNAEVVSVQDAASLLTGSPQAGVMKSSYSTAIGRTTARSTWQGGARLEHATLGYDGLGHLTRMTRYQDPASTAGARPVTSSWHYDSLGQILELDEPDSVPQLNSYSSWGELTEVFRNTGPAPSGGSGSGDDAPGTGDPQDLLSRWFAQFTQQVDVNLEQGTTRIVKRYDALGRMVHSEQQDNDVVVPETVNDYLYDQPVDLAPQLTATNVLGRLSQASSPTGTVSFSYDAFGQVNGRVFLDLQGGMYVEKHTAHADGTPAALDLFLPDTGYADEHVDYRYDSAGRGTSVRYTNGGISEDLFAASNIDPLGRVRQAQYGVASYAASYADVGRRLVSNVSVTSSLGSRTLAYQGLDPVGRERSRAEVKVDGIAGAVTTSYAHAYDALGRLASSSRTGGTATPSATPFSQQFTYDALGNLLGHTDSTGGAGATSTTLTYLETDRDRICHIRYGADAGTDCNVVYDQIGNVVEQPTRTGVRQLSFFADGSVRSATDGGTTAQFRYDAFGAVQELDLSSSTSPDTRHDRRYGGLIAWRDETAGASSSSVLTRTIPGPDGFVATRHGAGGSWTFAFGEDRGNRFFTDDTGAFVQDVDYSPYGEPTSTGAQPGSALYSHEQWNGGDALAALGLSHLGARLYDPVIGRFLSRDPLLIPRTATTTNPYSFAMNDPVNGSDPSGLCGGPEEAPCPLPIIFPGGGGGGGGSGGSSGGGGGGHPPAPPAPAVNIAAAEAQFRLSAQIAGTNALRAASVRENRPGWLERFSNAGNGVGLDVGYPDPMLNVAASDPGMAQQLSGPAAISVGALYVVGGAVIGGGALVYSAGPVSTGILGGSVVSSHVGEITSEAEEVASAFEGFGPRITDPGLAEFVARLENSGIKVLNVNVNIIGSNGNTLGEIDVVTENALIQYKDGYSSAFDIIEQVRENTEPFVSRTVVAFVNGRNRDVSTVVQKAARHVWVTNDFQVLLDKIR